MNAKQRATIAARLATIATAHGASVEVDNRPEDRSVYVSCDFPEVSVSFDVDDLHGGGILASWYGAKRALAATFADSVNPYHRTKATLYRNTADAFAEAFAAACAQVEAGTAYA